MKWLLQAVWKKWLSITIMFFVFAGGNAVGRYQEYQKPDNYARRLKAQNFKHFLDLELVSRKEIYESNGNPQPSSEYE